MNKTVQNESEKNEEFRNKQEKWNKNQEQKIDDLEQKFNQKIDSGFAQINQRLDKIENCPTIKKELAEQNKQINNLDANESKSNETDKSSTNDKKDEENN